MFSMKFYPLPSFSLWFAFFAILSESSMSGQMSGWNVVFQSFCGNFFTARCAQGRQELQKAHCISQVAKYNGGIPSGKGFLP